MKYIEYVRKDNDIFIKSKSGSIKHIYLSDEFIKQALYSIYGDEMEYD